MVLNFKYDLETKLYVTPYLEKEIYEIQKGDVFIVTNVIYVKSTEKTYVKVQSENGLEGYIKLSRNPYLNGEYEENREIEVDGETKNTLRVNNRLFLFYQDVKILKLPSENAEVAYEVNYKSNEPIEVRVKEITEDYEWVGVMLGDNYGWIKKDKLSADRGGLTLDIPEYYIEWDIISKNIG